MANRAPDRTAPLTVLNLGRPFAGGLATLVENRLVDLLRVAIALVLVANLGRIPLVFIGNKDAPVLITDLGVMTVVTASAYLALRERTLRLDVVAVTALIFAGIGAFSALLAIPRFGLTPFQFAFSIAYLLRWLVYFGLYLAVINFVRRADVPSVWGAFEWMVLVFAVFGIFQSIALPGFAQIVYPDSALYTEWDPQGRRLVSTFLDPNFAGALLMMALLVMSAWLTFGKTVPTWKVLVLITAIIFTVSRSTVIGMMAGGLVILAARGLSKRLLRIGGLVVLLTLPFIPLIVQFAAEYGKLEVGPSAIARVIMWARALEIFVDHPILGVGFNTYGFVQEAYGYTPDSRSSYTLDGGLLFVAVMTGLVGLTVYVTMIGVLLARCRRVWRNAARDAHDRGLALGVAAATVGLVIHSIFLNSLFLPFLMGPLWVLWGLVFLVRHPPESEGKVAAPTPVLVALPQSRGDHVHGEAGIFRKVVGWGNGG